MTDLSRSRGDTYADEFQIFSETTGAVVDITGYTFTMTLDTLKAPPNTDTNLYSLTGTITDAVNGLVEFVPSLIQANQAPGSYWYDVQMVDDVGRVRTIDSGKYVYVQDITK